MKLAYCKECKVVIAAGEIPEKSTSKHSLVVGEGDEARIVEHVATLVDAPDTAPLPGEKTGAYLSRLTKKLNDGKL